MENEKDEDLTYLTFANHKKHKNVQFFLVGLCGLFLR